MTIGQDLMRPALPAYVELYKLDLSVIGGEVLYFTPATVGGSTAVSFGGQEYMAMPIQGSGWESGINGAAPRPTLRISNVTRFIQPYLTAYRDLVGARLTRTLTFDKYLDSGTNPDSSQVFGTCTYLIEQKVKQSKSEVEFSLSSIIDAPMFKLPRGQVLRTEFPGAGLFRKS